jgi:hypothetical protein
MLKYKLYAQGGFTSAALAPRSDNSRTGAPSSSLSAGAVRRDRHRPLLHRTSLLENHINGKGILRSLKQEPVREKTICFNRFPVPSLCVKIPVYLTVTILLLLIWRPELSPIT